MIGLIRAARPLYLPGGVAIFALGALSAGARTISLPLSLGVLVVVAIHVMTHFINEVADEETDNREPNPTFLTGGSRAIQRGLTTPATLRRASVVAAGVAITAMAIQASIAGMHSLSVNVGMLFFGFAYSGRPFQFARRGVGENVTAFVMGVLVPAAGAIAASGRLPDGFIPFAACLFVAVFFARLTTALPDRIGDAATRKLTLTVLLGIRGTSILFLVGAIVGIALPLLLDHPSLSLTGLWSRGPGAIPAAGGIALWLATLGGKVRVPEVAVPMIGTGTFGAAVMWMLWRVAASF